MTNEEEDENIAWMLQHKNQLSSVQLWFVEKVEKEIEKQLEAQKEIDRIRSIMVMTEQIHEGVDDGEGKG
ncbi:hypothetical protein M1589_04775 [Candidatus Marsarchaeota archaeon]|nr:hypothetical protein [Candidatus Marsarchaeota archaeon]MCL5115425.1 hypothetical protein [Candidatus Marsarchaeota archaeon]